MFKNLNLSLFLQINSSLFIVMACYAMYTDRAIAAVVSLLFAIFFELWSIRMTLEN